MPAWVRQVGKRALPYDLERAPQGVGESVEAAPPVAAAVAKPPQPPPDGPKPPRPDGPQTPGLHRRCVHSAAQFAIGGTRGFGMGGFARLLSPAPCLSCAPRNCRGPHLTHIRANSCTQCVIGHPPRHHSVSQRASQLSLSRQLGHTAMACCGERMAWLHDSPHTHAVRHTSRSVAVRVATAGVCAQESDHRLVGTSRVHLGGPRDGAAWVRDGPFVRLETVVGSSRTRAAHGALGGCPYLH
jgi:hypothetical protein